MVKDLMLQLQEQGKWVSPGEEARRFKSTVKGFEMTWYGSKKITLNFSGEEGEKMKDKLKALVSKRLHKETKNSKAVLQEDSNKKFLKTFSETYYESWSRI